MPPLRVFVSATTRDLGSYRRAVAEWLRANGIEPVVQDEFAIEPDFVTISRMLLDQLKACDAVVCLIGDHFGAAPKGAPEGSARRSYTQLEYELARELKRPAYLFFTTPECPRDNPPADGDASDLQRAYRERLQQRNEIWYPFGSREHLLELLPKLSFRPAVGRPNNLPFESIGSLFKGRDEFLARLRRSLTEKPAHAAAVFSRQAIHGLGGVGKTRAAVEYALRFAAEYTALLFATADSPSALTSNLARLCDVLNLPERDETNVNKQAAAVQRWLERNPGWFLILDNVDTPEAAAEVEKLLPRLSAGHTVVTSRLANWGAEVEALELDVLDEAPAAEFLLERTANKRKATPLDPQEAAGLARDLDGLALALEQAGAFVAKHRCSFADYRSRWRSQEAKVIEWHDARAMKYPRSVATTWQTSADALTPDGRGLLNVLCWLAPDPVPLTLLAKLGTPEGASPIDVESACADLAEYSLVKWTDDNSAVKAHRLVQDVTRYRLPTHVRADWLGRSVIMVIGFLDGSPLDVQTWSELYEPGAPHAATVVKHGLETGLTAGAAHLLSKLGLYFSQRAEYRVAEPFLRAAVSLEVTQRGEQHHLVAVRLNNLAELLKETNRLSEAESLLRRALAIEEFAPDTSQSDVATTLGNLAGLLFRTNRVAEAESVFRRVLGTHESVFGPNHPTVARDLSNLAEVLLMTGQYSAAEPMYRRAQTILEATKGPSHPDVAIVLNNLGGLLQATGRHALAEAAFRRALVIDESWYGSTHPSVATTLNNLALLLKVMKRYDEAEPIYQRVLVRFEALFGSDHPSVAAILNNLAGLLGATGRNDEAEPLCRRALAIDEASYGANHPEVAKALCNLALLVENLGRPSDAEPLMRRAVRIWCEFKLQTGAHHRDWKVGVNNYVGLLTSALGFGRSEAMDRVLEVMAEVSKS